MNSKTKYLTNAAFIAAMYVVLTYLTNMVGLANGVIQVRLSEALCVMAYFTSAAIPGLTIGCFLSNLLTGCVIFDIIFGTIATLIGAIVARLIRKYKYAVPIPTIVANAVTVPLVLRFAYGIDLPYLYMFATVATGEIISAGVIGMFLMKVLLQIPYFRNNTKSSNKEGN